MMRALIGNWSFDLGVGLDDEAVAALTVEGREMRLMASVTPRLRVLIKRDPSGYAPRQSSDVAHIKGGFGCCITVPHRRLVSLSQVGLPRFCNHEVELTYDFGALVGQLARPHELPEFRSERRQNLDREHEFARRDVALRSASLRRAA
jgi:hypothetical protein